MDAVTTDLGRNPAASARFGVQLIGPFRLAGPDGAAIPIQGRRTRALLATLLLAPQQTMGRERLAGLFWGDRSDAQARASLRQCLLELRGVLAGVSADPDAGPMIATRETVALARGAFACDVLALRSALGGDDWETAAGHIDAIGAAPLLQDLELGGAYGEWLDVTRAEIDARIADGLARHLAAQESAGDPAAVKALATAWLRRDPLSEPAVAALIRAEIATGARAAAHIRYQAFRDLLAAEIGVAPGPLVDAALRSEAGAEPLVVAPVPPPPLLPHLRCQRQTARSCLPCSPSTIFPPIPISPISATGFPRKSSVPWHAAQALRWLRGGPASSSAVPTRASPKFAPPWAHRTFWMARCGAAATGCALRRS